jgi:hypothetical protein
VAKSDDKQPEIRENPLIAELISRGAENSTLVRGFVGPSRDDRYLTLYQNLARLSDTVDIPRDAILHVADVPGSALGAVMLWVKEDAQISVRRAQPEAPPTIGPGARLQEVTKGRLRMQLPTSRIGAFCRRADDDVCISWCDCSICQSICQMAR